MNDVTTKDGRVFYFLANIPYTKKDGAQTELVVWHSPCVDCGAPVFATTPLNFADSKAFLAKRCDVHKRKTQ